MIELHFLMGFMIVAAIIAVEVRDLLSSVVAVGAVGLGLSVAFLVLKAPDLAIVQMVVEITAVIILIRATITRDTTYAIAGTGGLVIIVTLVFIGLFLLFAWGPFKELPDFGSPRMEVASRYLEQGLPETGASNLVGSVILDYRAYDTLGEATVLFTAVIGVVTVMRRVGRKKPDEEAEAEDD
jgi:multisubunit Na+/H+ antiporter MnhB subunit